jgi:hypothetical protein
MVRWPGGWGIREQDNDLGPGNGKNHKEQKYKDKNVVYIGTKTHILSSFSSQDESGFRNLMETGNKPRWLQHSCRPPPATMVNPLSGTRRNKETTEILCYQAKVFSQYKLCNKIFISTKI